jgi:hypothetical protein
LVTLVLFGPLFALQDLQDVGSHASAARGYRGEPFEILSAEIRRIVESLDFEAETAVAALAGTAD